MSLRTGSSLMSFRTGLSQIARVADQGTVRPFATRAIFRSLLLISIFEDSIHQSSQQLLARLLFAPPAAYVWYSRCLTTIWLNLYAYLRYIRCLSTIWLDLYVRGIVPAPRLTIYPLTFVWCNTSSFRITCNQLLCSQHRTSWYCNSCHSLTYLLHNRYVHINWL